mmetsp:Transcript_153/g.388  ORF Transcript_153/g.388 Transcript_153/m.388 type:complete len:1944 (+) Transcript_153:467-6298(+)
MIAGRSLLLPLATLLLAASPPPVEAEDEINYTCFPGRDANPNSACPTQGDGVCDDPNLGGSGGDKCKNQDCIDCNVHCNQFEADCYGCLNAQGCYYCPEDGTCDNSDQYYSPNRVKQCTISSDYLSSKNGDAPDTCISSKSKTQDPTYDGSAWMFDMINAVDVWEEYGLTGEGVTVRINDDGVFVDHLEFEGRFRGAEDSCPDYLPSDGEGHGTKVAGIILGNRDNNLCAAGIAPNAMFSSCNFFAENVPVTMLGYQLDTFDISQNSIGMPACLGGASESQGDIIYEGGCPFVYEDSDYKPCEVCDGEFVTVDRALSASCEDAITEHCKYYYKDDSDACSDFPEVIIGGSCDYDKLPTSAVDIMESAIKFGRGGKGIIFAFASGNSFTELDDVNFNGWTNTRYTITIGAVGKDGMHADYSTGGAALTVVAPAGGDEDIGHLMTAGLGVDTCVDSGQGTSFATPVVSGVIALMLEANPELSWRDVQGILAATSAIVDDDEDTTALDNGGGYWHSNWYGFGLIDAKAAVEAAMDWQLFTDELQIVGMSADENAVLTDNANNEFVSSITIDPNRDNYPSDFITESTVVLLDLLHYNRGDLELELVSPSGTSSILHPGKIPENNQPLGEERWKLMSLKNWGETPSGRWQLKVRDLVDRVDTEDQNVFRTWKLIVYGRSESGQTNSGGTQDSQDSQKSEYCMDPDSPEISQCYMGPNGDSVCPAGSVITTGETKVTLDASLVCPTDVLMSQNIGYEKASQMGVCECEAGLYDSDCDVIEEDLECVCFACPKGSNVGIAYGCNKEIVSGCTSFDCDGTCNGEVNFPLASTMRPTRFPTSRPTDRPTDRPTERDELSSNNPTRKPTNNPTRNPTRNPTNNPTNNPTRKPTNEPTRYPTKAPISLDPLIIDDTAKPTADPTKRPTNTPTRPDDVTRTEPDALPSESPSESPTLDEEKNSGFALMDGNLACETGIPIDSETTPVEGTIRSFSLFGLEGDCLSGLESIGGWYQVVGNGNVFTLTACSLDSAKSVGISVFTGSCSELQCIENQSRQIAACKNGNGHSASFLSVKGMPYEILVSGLPIGAPLPISGSDEEILLTPKDRRLDEDELVSDFMFNLTDSEEPPNSNCGTALPTSFKNPISGSTMGELTAFETCYDTEKPGAWYSVTGEQPKYDGVIVYEANTCNPGSNFYNTISVFRGDECGSNECVDVDIVPCPSGWFGQQVYWSTSIEEDYKVFVHASDDVEALTYNAGNFRMDLHYHDRLANDQCNAAIEVDVNVEGAVKSRTKGAKPDMAAIENSSCGAGGAGAWYTVMGTGKVLQVSTCSGNTDHRTSIQVYSGSCGKLECIVSGDGNRALCDNGKGSVVNFDSQEDKVYTILVTARREGDTGSFGLEVNELLELEVNNDCFGAEPLGRDNPTVSGSTLKATFDFPPGNQCVVPLDSPGVWYEIKGQGKGVELSTCQDNNFDAAISVFSGGCNLPQCVAGSSAIDSACTDGKGVKTSFYAEKDKKYHAYVHGQSGSANAIGDFTLSYVEFDILEANEFCTGAREVPTDGTRVQGSTEDASRASIPTASCGVPITNPGLWYKFKGNGQAYEMRACSEDEGEFDVSLSIFEGGPGGCDTLTCLAGTTFPDTVCGATAQQRFLQGGGLSPSSEFRFMTDASQEYYIFVHGTGGSQGVGDFALYIRDENVTGFGTEAPTVTPIRYGKDLYRWIPVNTTMLVINTDYMDLEIVASPTSGNATIQGYWITYTPDLGFEGDDVMTFDGCNEGECFRFDVTVNVRFDREGRSAGGKDDDGWNKMWLLLLLLLLLIPLCCLPFYLFHKRKQREKEERDNYDDDYSLDDEIGRSDDNFDDEDDSDDDDKGLLPHQRKPNRRGDESSEDGDDWETSGDDDSDNDDNRSGSYSRSGDEDDDTRSRDSDDDSRSRDSGDDFADGFVGESEREGFHS